MIGINQYLSCMALRINERKVQWAYLFSWSTNGFQFVTGSKSGYFLCLYLLGNLEEKCLLVVKTEVIMNHIVFTLSDNCMSSSVFFLNSSDFAKNSQASSLSLLLSRAFSGSNALNCWSKLLCHYENFGLGQKKRVGVQTQAFF